MSQYIPKVALLLTLVYSGYLGYIDPNFRQNFGEIAYGCVVYWTQTKGDDDQGKHDDQHKK